MGRALSVDGSMAGINGKSIMIQGQNMTCNTSPMFELTEKTTMHSHIRKTTKQYRQNTFEQMGHETFDWF